MLQYGLLENLLTPAPDDCMAVTQNVRSYTEDEILEQMMLCGTTITRTDVKAVLQLYREVITSIVADGSAINTELINVAPSISGVFTNAADSFDASRHKININVTPGRALREAAARITVQKVQMSATGPYIAEVKDAVSGSVNSTVTAGNVLQLTGARLKFLSESDTNGVFLISASGESAEVRCTPVIENKPGRLMVIVPSGTPAGDYFVEVRTTYTATAKEAKTLKSGRYAKTVAIVAAG